MPSRNTGSFLQRSPLFATLTAREVEALAAVAVEETHRARDYVFLEGDPARWFCVVKSGRVKILRHSRASKDVVLELLGPGEVFGGVAVIERRPYPAAAQATEATVVVKIPADAMIAVAERHPTVIKEIALMIGRRLRAAHDSVESLAVDPVEARLAAALLRLAEREGAHGRDRVTLPFHLTRQSLADMTGTTRRDGYSRHQPLAQGGVAGRRRRAAGAGGRRGAPRAGRGRGPVAMPPLVRRYIKTSFLFLLTGLAVGGYVIVAQFVVGAYPPRPLITAHVHLLLAGFMLMIVMGVATWMFPRPARDDTRYRPELVEAVYWLMTLSTALRAVAEILLGVTGAPRLGWLIAAGGLGQLAAAVLFVLNMWWRVRIPPAAAPAAR